MALLHQSLFTGTDGTEISTLSPAVGPALVASAGSMVVRSNRARRTSEYDRYRTNQTFATANYVARMVVRRLLNTGRTNEACGVFARCNTALTTYLSLRVTRSSVELGKSVSGVYTSLGSYSYTSVAGTDYDWELVCDGTQISVRLNGSTVIAPVTVTDVTAAENVMFDIYMDGGDDENTFGWHPDTLEVNDTIPAGGPTPAPSFGRYGVRGPVR